MLRDLKVSCPLIVNMVPFVNISNSFKGRDVYIMTFRLAY
jgi:hypothetical protein